MSAWQPIATAPRDGNLILAYHEDGTYSVASYRQQPDGSALWIISENIDGSIQAATSQVTHWLPLPLPPDGEDAA